MWYHRFNMMKFLRKRRPECNDNGLRADQNALPNQNSKRPERNRFRKTIEEMLRDLHVHISKNPLNIIINKREKAGLYTKEEE